MTSSRTWVVPALAALVLSGCSYTINGDPLPEAGVTPASASTTPSAASDGVPKIGEQRSVAGVDPCKLLSADDLKPVGALTREPARRDDQIQESCQFVFDGASVVTALYQKYEHVRQRQPKGREVLVEGHSSWVSCEQDGNAMVCTTTTAVNPNRSILVAMTLVGGKGEQMVATLQPLVKAALNRLPPG
ncbi:DUF3558 family protein [Actinosynnema sp. NPDC023587]|uniref:DUF3558 family protein n=1 Tax=Actinosynnema sp. NPDC023587 TaxID=3154695 RepID=UPI0033E53598